MTIYIKPTVLYIKQHSVTGMKYFGKTTKDPYKYNGSGKHWRRHIKKHGKEYIITTRLFGPFTDKDALIEFALAFSRDNNIVESELWANQKPENGLDGWVPGVSRGPSRKRGIPTGPTGPRGKQQNPRGPTGPRGKQQNPHGPTGPTGPRGKQQNPHGPYGPRGPYRKQQNPYGPRGPYGKQQNPHGPYGPTGPTGPRGKQQNPRGPTGPNGRQGKPTGPRGKQQNPHGPRGPYGKQRNPAPEVKCPHCGLVGRGGNMTRRHFDNCKMKPL